MGIVWMIIIGFVVGVVAKFIMPGSNEPQGFIMTTILGIVGAFVASYLGQALGWYTAGQGAGLIGSVVGAIIVLGGADDTFLKVVGFVAMALATANVVGGWFVTDRMLEMFKRRPEPRKESAEK